jgi:hypothetical protein
LQCCLAARFWFYLTSTFKRRRRCAILPRRSSTIFLFPRSLAQTEVDDIRSKAIDVEEEEGSTASSGSNAREPFEDEDGDEVVIEEEEWGRLRRSKTKNQETEAWVEQNV